MSLIRKVKAAQGGARQDSSTNKPCRDETLGKPGGLHIRAYSTRRPGCARVSADDRRHDVVNVESRFLTCLEQGRNTRE